MSKKDSDKKSKKNYANVDKFQKVAKVIKKPMQFYLSNIKRDAFSKAIKQMKSIVKEYVENKIIKDANKDPQIQRFIKRKKQVDI